MKRAAEGRECCLLYTGWRYKRLPMGYDCTPDITTVMDPRRRGFDPQVQRLGHLRVAQRPRSPSPRGVQRRITSPESPCYILLTRHSPNR